MKIIQHYAQGGKHKANNIPCEDRTYYMCANGVSVIALADGAGGKRYTHAAAGAECVTKTISEFFCNNFDKFYDIKDENEMKSVFTAVCHHNLKIAAEKVGVDDIVKLSSTLLIVAVKQKNAIVCHIGDGVIGMVTTHNTRVVSVPENGEFANHTFFISNPAAAEHLHIKKIKTDDVVAFFLMSDGTAEYVYDEDAMRFHDSARKMSLMANEENGEEKLAETIEKYMIGPDPSSDDCSFITMLFDEKVKSLDIGLPKDVYEGETVAEKVSSPKPVIVEDGVYENNYTNKFEKTPIVDRNPIRSQNVALLKIIAAVIALISIAVLVFTFVTAGKISKNKKELEANAKFVATQKNKEDTGKKENKTEEKTKLSNKKETSEKSDGNTNIPKDKYNIDIIDPLLSDEKQSSETLDEADDNDILDSLDENIDNLEQADRDVSDTDVSSEQDIEEDSNGNLVDDNSVSTDG